ncbi:hypothetical protein C6V80_09660 [Caminibacter pacificus]|uniref:Uncharacterized protein n=1 Tax=Caminibacter pacificus TaxID=1424653 RepID=A0ABX5VVE8_9BACT|nr:hypothetical protein [Caminibacter pacificus]QDD68107.1 hypothetical protein C6V80_09660 [Caminibacter pacificus]
MTFSPFASHALEPIAINPKEFTIFKVFLSLMSPGNLKKIDGVTPLFIRYLSLFKISFFRS